MASGGLQALRVPDLRLILCLYLLIVLIGSGPPAVAGAQDACSAAPLTLGCSPQPALQGHLGPWDVDANIRDLGVVGFLTELTAHRSDTPAPPAAPDRAGPGTSVGRTIVARVYCRRDDYAFLPPTALAGIPCDTATPDTTVDPREIARAMFDQMPMPDLRLGMNPSLGMVAVPTWFWIEGYNGDVIPLVDHLVLAHEECQRIPVRDADGHVRLDSGRAPVTRRECHTVSDTLTVEVRAWPRQFDWSFGDSESQPVLCPAVAACPAGIGLPFVDSRTPSPIAHAYRWSSLGQNGLADAYTVQLRINFGAQYRFSTNGASSSGWQTLADRALSWSASHQVREAQAVLTRP